MKLPFQLWKRGNYFYYRLPVEKSFHSTGLSSKRRAIDLIYERIREGKGAETKLKVYAESFFIWDECDWIKRQHAKGRSFSKTMADMRRGHLKNYLFPQFGDICLSEINAVKFENWLIHLPLANQTKNHIFYTLNIILKEARREKLIISNPLADVEPMAEDYVETSPFSLDELKLLFPEDRKKLLHIWKDLRWAALFNLLAATGIRSGEVRALIWKNVLWDLKGILILKAVKSDGTIGDPKKKEKRGIFLQLKTLRLISEWYAKAPFNEPDHLTFYGLDPDRPYGKDTLMDHFRPALDRAGIDATGRNLKVHSFRHTFNTLMREILPEKILREFTGHRSVKMTDRYDHPNLEKRLKNLQETRPLIESVWNF